MAKIFISHSSKDKKFVRQLAGDLKDTGHLPWLDEWEIKVGECIAKKIEEGIYDADYVVIVLSKNATVSEWFDREWKSVYWDEVNNGKTIILPVLVEDCNIPKLLQTKKYADFRENYTTAFDALLKAVNPTIKTSTSTVKPNIAPDTSKITALLAKIQSCRHPLAECIAEALVVGKEEGDASLEIFCTGELTGWPQHLIDTNYPHHRVAKMYASLGQQINMDYFGWDGNAARAMEFIKSNPSDFIPTKLLFNHPISKIEADSPSDIKGKLVSISGKAKDFFPQAAGKTPDIPVYLYTDSTLYRDIINATKNQLTKLLIELLPQVQTA
jgi:hypothetical protein